MQWTDVWLACATYLFVRAPGSGIPKLALPRSEYLKSIMKMACDKTPQNPEVLEFPKLGYFKRFARTGPAGL